MLISQLPPELIREILFHLDPASFYICVQTAKIFREHALTSKALLRAHLARIPGQRILPAEIERWSGARGLLKLFGHRANLHLFNSAEKMADVFVWRPEQPVDTKISGILCWKGLAKLRMSRYTGKVERGVPVQDTHALAYSEVQPERGIVTLYSLLGDGVNRLGFPGIYGSNRNGHRPRIQYIISPSTVSGSFDFYDMDGNPQYKIMKVTTYLSGLAVLYAPLVSMDSAEHKGAVWKLAIFRVHRKSVISCTKCLDIQQEGSHFLDLAVDSDARITVGWRSVETVKPGQGSIKLKFTQYPPVGGRYGTYKVYLNPYVDGMSRLQMSLRGKNIDLVRAAGHLPSYTCSNIDVDPNASFTPQSTRLPYIHTVIQCPSMGYALATDHQCALSTPWGHAACMNTVLKLVISRGSHLPMEEGTAFLLKAFEFREDCHSAVNWEGSGLYQYVIVARLEGMPDLSNLSTRGLILALSPHSRRLAVASWRTLVVYAVEPRAFLNRKYDRSFAVDPDPEYPDTQLETLDCGWHFYSNAAREQNHVVLEPAKLECKSVVYGLEWRSEDELWAWGEEGVVRWYMGAMATGRRGHGSIGGDWLEKASRMCRRREDS